MEAKWCNHHLELQICSSQFKFCHLVGNFLRKETFYTLSLFMPVHVYSQTFMCDHLFVSDHLPCGSILVSDKVTTQSLHFGWLLMGGLTVNGCQLSKILRGWG